MSALHQISPREFEEVQRLAYKKFGLELRSGKEQLVAARLGKKLRELGLKSFDDYLRHVETDHTGEALIHMIDALATNHTSFFRESAHFEFLGKKILPELERAGRIMIWSAASSTGEEPYSIALFLRESLPAQALSKVRILATDISTKALAKAEQAIYSSERLRDFPPEWGRRGLLRGTGRWEGSFRIKPEVRRMVEFRRLNLIEPLPALDSFQVIFCRNVMIYFDKPTQEKVIAQLTSRLDPGGWMLVGHSESLNGINHRLQYVQPAVYRNPARGGGAA